MLDSANRSADKIIWYGGGIALITHDRILRSPALALQDPLPDNEWVHNEVLIVKVVQKASIKSRS